jgi:hypothetical protein
MVTVRNPPTVTEAPASQVVAPGQSVALSVSATGTAPLSFQWRLNGTNITGATTSTLLLTNLSVTDAGQYTVMITDGFGSTIAVSAKVSVFSISLLPVVVIGGSIGSTYEIQFAYALGDTNHWISLTNIVLDQNPYFFIDTTSASTNRRFYRAKALP